MKAHIVELVCLLDDEGDLIDRFDTPLNADAIMVGDNLIRVDGPDNHAIIAIILAHLNGATHADPR